MKNHKKSNYVLIVTCFLILFSLNFVSSASNNNSINHDIDLIAGSSKCIEDELINTETHSVTITDIAHTITNQNGKTILEGITITIHEEIDESLKLPITIPAGETFSFYICYNTDIRLKPGTYNMVTDFIIETIEDETEPAEEDIVTRGIVGNIIRGMSIPPVADAGEPYFGFPDENIIFDGSESYAQEGKNIVGYRWDYTGDGSWDTDWLTTPFANHTYTVQGEYIVTLQVTDNDGLTSTNTTTVTIIAGNYPPTQPVVTGETIGSKNLNYSYTAFSTDEENDTIRYTFEWGDGTNITTDFLPNATIATVNHSWAAAGKYHMWVQAMDDKNASSLTKRLTVLIDAINVGELGYLTDDNANGTYDTYHSNDDTIQTTVEKIDDNEYLLDTTGDDEYNYVFRYNTETEEWELTAYKTPVETIDEESNILFYIAAALIVIIVLLWFFLAVRKKR
jgi:hypothetical protein